MLNADSDTEENDDHSNAAAVTNKNEPTPTPLDASNETIISTSSTASITSNSSSKRSFINKYYEICTEKMRLATRDKNCHDASEFCNDFSSFDARF